VAPHWPRIGPALAPHLPRTVAIRPIEM
jgi:hypothetical protein